MLTDNIGKESIYVKFIQYKKIHYTSVKVPCWGNVLIVAGKTIRYSITFIIHTYMIMNVYYDSIGNNKLNYH